MRKRTKRLIGMIALAAGAVGASGAMIIKMRKLPRKTRMREPERGADVWARPGMIVTFRAELMPGRDASERVYRVKSLLPSGRVLLHDCSGEHTEKEFERIRVA